MLAQWCCGSCSWFPAAALVLQLHCYQPPPRYQSRGYGGAAIVALRLLLACCTYSRRCPAAASVLQAHNSHPRPVTNRGAMGRLRSGHSFRTAAVAAGVLQLLLCRSCCVAKPAVSTSLRLYGAAPAALRQQLSCSGSCSWFSAAAVVLQLHCSQWPPRYQSRGYGGAAITAFKLQRGSCSCSSWCLVAA